MGFIISLSMFVLMVLLLLSLSLSPLLLGGKMASKGHKIQSVRKKANVGYTRMMKSKQNAQRSLLLVFLIMFSIIVIVMDDVKLLVSRCVGWLAGD